MRRSFLTGVVLAAALVLAAVGAAGSGIVYVKNGNVWVARGDGTGAARITSDGTAASPYRSPSRDARGNVVAERDGLVYRFTASGARVGTPYGVSDPGITGATRQPLGLALSPGGSTLGLFVYGTCLSRASQCPKTMTTPVGAFAPPSDYNLSSAFPSWLGDGELVMVNEPDGVLHQALPGAAVPWFRGFTVFGDPGSGLQQHLDEVAVSPARDKVALVSRICGATPDTCQESLEVLTVAGPIPTTAPTPACKVAGSDYSSPTWSPSGTELAFATPSGISVADVSAMASGCGSVGIRTVIPGGESPEWGKADPPTASAPSALRSLAVRVVRRNAILRIGLRRAAVVRLELRRLRPRARVLDRARRRLGKGAWQLTLRGLSPGTYRLKASVADGRALSRRFVVR